MPDRPWSLVSGLLGICSVVLGAQGNILTFIFGFAQVGTYTYLCIQERFYAEIALNAYYFITMIYGIYIWKKRLHTDSLEIHTRSMPGRWLGGVMLLMVVMSVGVGWCLQRFTDDPQPYLDAWTTIPALVAQILMVLAFREQWYIWLLVDLLAFVMWLRAGDYCMAAQYLFWCANCVYGYVQWSKDNRLNRS
jgi:nicotinamide mononucleotide transporter